MGASSSASRVRDLLVAASNIADDQACARVFPRLFGLSEVTPGNLQQDQTYQCISDLRAEVRIVENGITEEEKAHSADAIKSAYNFTNYMTLNESWNSLRKNHLRAEVLTAWHFLAIHFKHNAPEIPAEEFTTLSNELNELEKAASAEGVPDDLRQFIAQQIDRIRKAIRRYKVIGEVALRDALRQGYGEAFCSVPAMDNSSPQAKVVFGKLGKVWKHASTLARDFNSLHAFAQIMATHAPAFAQLASNLPALT